MRVLMCPPIHFAVQEENSALNPWMKKDVQPDRKISLKQWQNLGKKLLTLGLDVYTLRSQEGLGDMCFAANTAWGQNNVFVMAEFHPEVWWRKEETTHYAEWLVKNRCGVCFLPEGVYFEGQGDVVSLNNSYIFGHGQRNSLEVIDYLDEHFRLKRIVPVELIDSRFYHLDVSLHFARGANSIIWCPDAFSPDSQRKIERLMDKEKMSGLALTAEEAIQNLGNGRTNFLLNSVYAGKNEVMCWDEEFSEFPAKVREFIESKSCKIWPINVSEFGCSGGGARCLTLFLD